MIFNFFTLFCSFCLCCLLSSFFLAFYFCFIEHFLCCLLILIVSLIGANQIWFKWKRWNMIFEHGWIWNKVWISKAFPSTMFTFFCHNIHAHNQTWTTNHLSFFPYNIFTPIKTFLMSSQNSRLNLNKLDLWVLRHLAHKALWKTIGINYWSYT
jgi:hypothetical protein